MADQKISQLPTITGANMADDDKFVLVDTSGDATVATTRAEFFKNTPDIDVTGAVTADGLTVDGNSSINSTVQSSSTSNQLTLRGGTGNVVSGNVVGGINFDSFDLGNQNTSASISAIASGNHVSGSTLDTDLNFKTADGASAVTRLNIGHNGDISFYEDTGTTAKFFWDASTERLGIGNSSPATALDVTGTVTADSLTVDGAGTVSGSVAVNTSGSGDGGILVGPTGYSGSFVYKSSGDVEIAPRSGKNLIFANSTGGVERMRIDSSGRLLVGLTGASGFGTVETDSLTTTGQCIFARTGGKVGIGTSSPSADSILDVQSTTKGVRFPNMTTTQKNAMGDVAGNMVFDTTLGKMCFNTGSGWETITSS